MFGRINVALLALHSLQSLHTHTNSRNHSPADYTTVAARTRGQVRLHEHR